MNFSEIIDMVVNFSRDNPIIAGVVALVFLFLAWRRPKFFFSVLLLALLLFGSIYLIVESAKGGKEQKQELIQKGEKQVEKLN